jgi:hypothetical protein
MMRLKRLDGAAELPMADPYLQHLTEANKIFADQIKAADQKAAYVFTFLLAMLVWSSETRRAFNWEHLTESSPATLIVSVVLSLSIITSLVSAVLVVAPRSRPGRSLFFWGAWPAAGERLVAARQSEDEGFLFAEYMENTRTLAAICQSKYRTVAVALRALLCTVIAYAILLLSLPG